MEIVQATTDHAEKIAVLFDLYRQFYHCEPDPDLALRYIRARLENGESVIFVAMDGADAKGFTQLYPSFCSVEAVPIFILYDLYVDRSVRNGGVGAQLMNHARHYARDQGAARIDLLTQDTNKAGQHLYEKLGYVRTLQDFYAYSLALHD